MSIATIDIHAEPKQRVSPDLVIGADTSRATSLQDVLVASNLDWGIETVDGNDGMSVIIGDTDRSTFAPGRQLLLRGDNHVVLGMVGDNYFPVSNAMAFAPTEYAAELGATYRAAGSSDFGRKTFVTMDLPDAGIRVGGQDAVSFSIVFRTDHTGTGSVTGALAGRRLWCTNGCTAALRVPMKWSVRHSASAAERIEMVRETVRGSIDYAHEFSTLGERLIRTPMSRRDYLAYIERLYPHPGDGASKRALTMWDKRRQDLMGLFQTAAIQQDSPNTAWAAVSAATEYDQWYRGARSAESRARRQFDGASDRFTEAAFRLIEDYANA